MLPERAGQPTQIQLHMTLRELRGIADRSDIEDSWFAARAAGYGLLTGLAAEAAGCDAAIVPVVSGHVDYSVLAELAGLFLATSGPRTQCAICPGGNCPRVRGNCPQEEASANGGEGRPDAGDHCASGHCADVTRTPLSPATMARLSHALLSRAADVLSGPAGLAALLRGNFAPAGRPLANISLPLDIGRATEEIPAHLRRAVILRDRCCRFPGCQQPPAASQVHHIRPRRDGGTTSLGNMILLCRFHHLIAVHRWGWAITLHPDGTVTAAGPDGRILRSHSPPTLAA